MTAARDAKSIADNKRRIFTSTPTVPYDIGDLWVNGSTVKYAISAKTESQSYDSEDWSLTATDDTLAKNAIKSSIQLWFTKANDTAPQPPRTTVTSTSTTGNAWTTVVPVYDSNYPNYFYCYQQEKNDGNYTWTTVVFDNAMTEAQNTARAANQGLATKVDTQTYQNFVNEIDEYSNTITSLSETIGEWPSGETYSTVTNVVSALVQTSTSQSSKLEELSVTTSNIGSNSEYISRRVNLLERDLDGFTSTVSNFTNEVTRAKSLYFTSTSGSTAQTKTTNSWLSYITDSSGNDLLDSSGNQIDTEVLYNNFALYPGVRISVIFTNANSAVSPKLNVNSTGAVPIKSHIGADLEKAEYAWKANTIYDFMYNGICWLLQDSGSISGLHSAESSIKQNADNIELRVKTEDYTTAIGLINGAIELKVDTEDYTGSNVVSMINLSNDSVKIEAEHVEIDGAAIFNNQAFSTSLNNTLSNIKGVAIKNAQQIYYRSSSSSKPNPPSSWVSETGNRFATNHTTMANWTTKYSPLVDNGVKYAYLWTCTQYTTVNDDVANSPVVLDDSTTIIDGGNIITSSITANKLDASSINASNMLAVGSFATDEQSKILNENIKIGGRNLLLGTSTSKSCTIASDASSAYTSSYVRSGYLISKESSLTTNDYFTVSFDWTISGNSLNTCAIYAYIYNASTGSETVGLATSGRYTKTFKLGSTRYNNILNETNIARHRFRINEASPGSKLTVFNVMLEFGTTDSTWAIAPEDLETKISDTNQVISTEIAERKATYGTCSSSASVQEKVVSCDNFELVAGNTIAIYMQNANTYSSGVVTLNINDTGPKNVWVANQITSSTNQLRWAAGAYLTFRYDGTQFITVGEPRTWYGASTSSASTGTKSDSASLCTGVVICKGTEVVLSMSYKNTSSEPQLNISSTGAIAIYSSSSNERPTEANGMSWLPGDAVSFKFDGSSWRTGGRTYINGDNIITGTISADRIGTNSLSIGKLNTNDINAIYNWYATCTTDASTSTKQATITPETTAFSLTIGVSVRIKFTNTNTASVSSLKLSVNNTTAKSIKYNTNSSIADLPEVGYLASGRLYGFIYDGTYWVMQHNTDTTNKVKYDADIKVADNITAGHIICGTSAGYKNIASGVTFDISYPLLYAKASLDTSISSESDNYLDINNVNFVTNGILGGGATGKTVYLVGSLSGTSFTIGSSTWLTCSVPTSANGNFYIPIGILTTSSIGYFHSTNEVWAYINDKFGIASQQQALASAKTATAYITNIDDDGIKVHAVNNPNYHYSKIDATGMTVYKGGNQVAQFGSSITLGSTSSQGLIISSSGTALYNGGDQIAKFGNSIILGSTTSQGARVDSNGMQVFKNGSAVAQFGESVTLGSLSGQGALINSSGMSIYKGGSQVASFGNEIVLGSPSDTNSRIGSYYHKVKRPGSGSFSVSYQRSLSGEYIDDKFILPKSSFASKNSVSVTLSFYTTHVSSIYLFAITLDSEDITANQLDNFPQYSLSTIIGENFNKTKLTIDISPYYSELNYSSYNYSYLSFTVHYLIDNDELYMPLLELGDTSSYSASNSLILGTSNDVGNYMYGILSGNGNRIDYNHDDVALYNIILGNGNYLDSPSSMLVVGDSNVVDSYRSYGGIIGTANVNESSSSVFMIGQANISRSSSESIIIGIDNKLSNIENWLVVGFRLNINGNVIRENTGDYSGGLVCGIMNKTVQGMRFCVGNGAAGARKNAFVVLHNGSAYVSGTTSSNGNSVTSDKRIKTLIADITLKESRRFISRLIPRKYFKKTNNGFEKQIGFYAQDIEDDPDFGEYLVSIDNSGNYDLKDFRLLNYQGIIAPMVGAIQDLQNRVDSLEQENAELKKKNEELEQRLTKIEEILYNLTGIPMLYNNGDMY